MMVCLGKVLGFTKKGKSKSYSLEIGVHFKSGDFFKGQLVVDESGSADAPIHFTAHGEGELPIIDGAALFEAQKLLQSW